MLNATRHPPWCRAEAGRPSAGVCRRENAARKSDGIASPDETYSDITAGMCRLGERRGQKVEHVNSAQGRGDDGGPLRA